MPTNVEGEFELVLGNRQLMSVFFIVVVLLGVFFAMGYVVGRNLAPEHSAASPDKPIEVASALPRPEATTPAPPPVTAAEPPAPPAATGSPSDTKPSPVPAPVEVASAKPPVTAPKPEPAKPVAAVPKPAPAPPPVKPAAVAKPVTGGMYLQVGATTADKVDKLTKQLSELGFRSTTQSVPDSPLVRVLAGPFDSDLLSKAKADLEKAGLKSFPRKM